MHDQALLELIRASLDEDAESRIDWKSEIGDAEMVLRSSYPQYSAIFDDPALVALLENYSSEAPEDYLPAIGQELSCHGLVLYVLEEDGDSYCLLVVPDAHAGTLESVAKTIKQKIHRQKQPRKKAGQPAKRLKLAARLEYEKQAMAGRLDFKFPFLISKRQFYRNNEYSHSESSICDMRHWPLLLCPAPTTGYGYSAVSDCGLLCVIADEFQVERARVLISHAPLVLDSWHEISQSPALDEGGIPPLSKPCWLGTDLLVIKENKAWWVPDVGSTVGVGDKQVLPLAAVPKNFGTIGAGVYPSHVRTLDGSDYVLFYKQFYLWSGGTLKHTGVSALDHSDFGAVPTGAKRFVYVAKGVLVEVDMSNGRCRTRPLPFLDRKSYLRRYNDEWVVFLRFGYTEKELDIAQFWNPETDEWLRMPLGMLGKHGIRDLCLVQNYVLIDTGDELILKVQDLLTKLRSATKSAHTPEPWSEVRYDVATSVPKAVMPPLSAVHASVLPPDNDAGRLVNRKSLLARLFGRR